MIDFEDLNPVNSKAPVTIASANTIAPKTRFTRITGIVPIQYIIPPIEEYHELVLLIEADYGGFPTFIIGGNIQFSIAPPAAQAVLVGDFGIVRLFYDPRFRKYYIIANNVSYGL
jgi:hypothetical protein